MKLKDSSKIDLQHNTEKHNKSEALDMFSECIAVHVSIDVTIMGYSNYKYRARNYHLASIQGPATS